VVVFNNGDGTFDHAQTYGVGIEPMSLVIADLDGDGDLDLAAINAFSAKGTGTASILLNRRIP